MPITLRNKPVEELIRKIGARTGEGPSAVIARAVADLEAKSLADQEQKAAKKMAAMNAALSGMPVLSREQKDAVWEELERINEELFLDASADDRS